MEVFPVAIALKGEAIWLGWVSPEDGHEFFLTEKGVLIFSCDGKSGLLQEVMKVFPDVQSGVESFFDFDSVAEAAGRGVILDGNLVLDTWNLLIDVHHTFGSEGRVFDEYHDVYSRVFSQSEAAPIVGVQKVELSAGDIAVVREVFDEGFELLAHKIRIAKAARAEPSNDIAGKRNG